MDRVLIWIGALGTAWAAMTWIASKLEVLGGLGWPEYVFLGLGAAALLAFALSAVLVGWRYFNPLPSAGRDVPHLTHSPESAELDAVKAQLAGLQQKLDDLSERNDFVTHADLHRHDERFVEVDERLKFIRGLADGLTSQVDNLGQIFGMRHRQAKERMDSIAKGCADLERKTKDVIDIHLRDVQQRFDNVDEGFAAIAHLQWAQRMFDELKSKAEELLARADALDSVQAAVIWLNEADGWSAELDQWLIIAESYAPGTTKMVRSTKGDLSALQHNQFFDGAGIRTYQDFVIHFENLKRVRQRVEKRIHQAGYIKPSKKGAGVDLGPTTD